MAKPHIGWDNWFLVIPAAILGLVALWTINRMYRAGDIRRSIEVVTRYEASDKQPLGEYLAGLEGDLACEAEVLSRFYGTLDVTCVPARSGTPYTWRVHVGQRAFAPGNDAARDLMSRYAPTIFGASESDVES